MIFIHGSVYICGEREFGILALRIEWILRVGDDLHSVGMLGLRESFISRNEDVSSKTPKWGRRERERGRERDWIFPVGMVGLSLYKD